MNYELIWLFLTGSFNGWVLETLMAAWKNKRFVNRGLVNGPFCVLYGAVLVVLTVFYGDLPLFWLFCSSVVLSTVAEWVAGHVIEWLYHEKWWDYSNIKWNLDGYICFPMSMLWGVLGLVCVRWINPFLLTLYRMIPSAAGAVVIWILIALLALDILATLIVIAGKEEQIKNWELVDSWFMRMSGRLGEKLYILVNGRFERAYPRRKEYEKSDAAAFASGCSFYKVVLLFFIGSLLGDITETIFCRITAGVWMSRSSLVWGPFSIVWGLAIALVTVMLYRYKDRSSMFLFLTGTVLGGAYEYLCSVLTEIMFGTVFWDYSKIPFNLGGRINLLYCFFWGFAAVVWFKALYPKFSDWIEKIPKKLGKVITWAVIVFMVCNMTVSFLALVRQDERSRGVPAEHTWQQVMDEKYDDEKLEKIYPNAIKVET